MHGMATGEPTERANAHRISSLIAIIGSPFSLSIDRSIAGFRYPGEMEFVAFGDGFLGFGLS